MKTFPEGFFWGSATASFQVEGRIENTDWSYAARQGRVPYCGMACDHYNLYEQDFDLVQKLGQNTHKISLEWARIEPQEGQFNQKEIEHYKRVLDALHRRNIRPIVNLWHFTLPIWFAEIGGFENKRAPEIFANYCKHVMQTLGSRSEIWLTLNEPMVFSSNGYIRGNWPPFKKNPFLFLRVIKNLIETHNTAYKTIKQYLPNVQVGLAKNNIFFHSNWNPINKLRASFMNWFWNRRFLDGISENQDFIGLNYYFHKKFGDKALYKKTDMGWDIYPNGLYGVLIELKKYKKPIIVIENGIADSEDKYRAQFIIDHISAVHRALTDGVDIKGYLHWSLLDNYEWVFGFEKHFGLVEVNYNSQTRTIRPSALVYKKICNANGIEI